MLGYAAIQTHEMRAQAAAADAVAQACAKNQTLIGRVGRAFSIGSLQADDLPSLTERLGEFWRRVARGAPHRGALVIPTPRGGVQITREGLPAFFCVPAGTKQERLAAGALAQKFLQLYGAAHLSARGNPEQIAALLRGLMPGEGGPRAATISGMLAAAIGTQEDPGPAWAAPLRPKRRTLDAKRLRLLRAAQAAFERTGHPAGTGAPGVSFTRPDLTSLRQWLESAEARLDQHEEGAKRAKTSAQRIGGGLRSDPAAVGRPAPPSG